MNILFGENSELNLKASIKQPGQFAAKEQVIFKTSKNEMKLRVIGPLRSETQIELSLTDTRILGINAPIRNSGDLEDSAGGATLIGPNGILTLERGIIIAARHIHLDEMTSQKHSLKNGDLVSIKANGPRGLIFNNVLVRTGAAHANEIHLDTDEANACGLASGTVLDIIY
jgi:putative phosphotransacetylase